MKLTRRHLFKTATIAALAPSIQAAEIETPVDDSLGAKINRSLNLLIQSDVVTKPEIWICKEDFEILCEHPAFENRDDVHERYRLSMIDHYTNHADYGIPSTERAAQMAQSREDYKAARQLAHENYGIAVHGFKGARVITDISVNRTIVTGWRVDGIQCSYDLEGNEVSDSELKGPYKETK